MAGNDSAPKPSKPPLPSQQSQKGLLRNDTSLDITPTKAEKPRVTRKREKTKPTTKKKVTFIENNYPPENDLSKPNLNTTNLLRRQIRDCQADTLSLDRALKEIQLSDTLNTDINEKVSGYLNYKLEEKKYSNLTSIQDDGTKPERVVMYRKAPNYNPREKKKDLVFDPHPMDFWDDEDFITEEPFTDFELDWGDYDDGSGDDREAKNDSLYYIYRKLS